MTLSRGLVALMTVVAALTVTACGSRTPATRTYTIHGTVIMVGEMPADCDMAGIMDGYYADLHEGADIVVKDLKGTVLTTATLSAAKPSRAVCEWTYSARVPKVTFYSVTVPHGGDVIVPFTQLEKDRWSLQTQAK